MRAWAFLGMLFLQAAALHAGEPAPKFVVHEWGVMVRAATSEGTRLGAPSELLADLPGFALRHHQVYTPKEEFRGWNKPVLHFYGAPDKDVTVRVLTAEGFPLCYYPKPKLLEETFWSMGAGRTLAIGMEWTGTLRAAPPENLPQAAERHWWSVARKVPGLYVQTAEGSERFLFYEGTAQREPAVRGRVTALQLILSNTAETPAGPCVVILNDGKTRWGRVVEKLEAKGRAELDREALLKTPWDDERTLEACRKQWRELGMTEDEARAIVEIWKPDLLEHPGFLVCGAMPRAAFDAMFPLTITPAPDELARVGMVFDHLPGETERLSWLPELDQAMGAWYADFEHENFEARKAAADRFAALGDLAKPFLEARKDQGGIEARNLVKTLLAALEPAKVEPLPAHGIGGKPGLIQRVWKKEGQEALRLER
ncbi:MAG: hypothetical protein M5U26_10705 [Planctomycetota bacterium]|nr:hypothetical protein [Planctomycetota bacterium]